MLRLVDQPHAPPALRRVSIWGVDPELGAYLERRLRARWPNVVVQHVTDAQAWSASANGCGSARCRSLAANSSIASSVCGAKANGSSVATATRPLPSPPLDVIPAQAGIHLQYTSAHPAAPGLAAPNA